MTYTKPEFEDMNEQTYQFYQDNSDSDYLYEQFLQQISSL
jgi:hypothetical protein